MKETLRILMLEDRLEDSELVQYELRKGKLEFEAVRVDTMPGFEKALREFEPHIILADYNLPTLNGVQALSVALVEAPDVPFIFVSGKIGEELAIETLKGGATDYIMKDNLKRLVPAIRRALDESEVLSAKRNAEEELKRSLERIELVLEQTVTALSSVTEIRDPYTAGHQFRVARLSCAVAMEMGFDSVAVEEIGTAALLHDIGKIAVPAEILSKPARLSEEEFSLVRTHSEGSFQILEPVQFGGPVALMVYQHHERMDGSGYPKGLRGDNILRGARILGVADVLEAMASHRPYRPAHPIEVAIEEILRGKGVLYDPDVVEATLAVYERLGPEGIFEPGSE